FESHTASLLRAVPLSQVQSANAKGTLGSGLAAGDVDVDSVNGWAGSAGTTASAVLVSLPGALSAADDSPCAALPFSCNSSCSIRAFIALSSFATSAGTARLGVVVGWAAWVVVDPASAAAPSGEGCAGSGTSAP